MDESVAEAWIDSVVSHLIEAMPEMPVEDVLGILSGLSPWNFQVDSTLDSRGIQPFEPFELLDSPHPDQCNAMCGPASGSNRNWVLNSTRDAAKLEYSDDTAELQWSEGVELNGLKSMNESRFFFEKESLTEEVFELCNWEPEEVLELCNWEPQKKRHFNAGRTYATQSEKTSRLRKSKSKEKNTQESPNANLVRTHEALNFSDAKELGTDETIMSDFEGKLGDAVRNSILPASSDQRQGFSKAMQLAYGFPPDYLPAPFQLQDLIMLPFYRRYRSATREFLSWDLLSVTSTAAMDLESEHLVSFSGLQRHLSFREVLPFHG